jgi:hypothetical protein
VKALVLDGGSGTGAAGLAPARPPLSRIPPQRRQPTGLEGLPAERAMGASPGHPHQRRRMSRPQGAGWHRATRERDRWTIGNGRPPSSRSTALTCGRWRTGRSLDERRRRRGPGHLAAAGRRRTPASGEREMPAAVATEAKVTGNLARSSSRSAWTAFARVSSCRRAAGAASGAGSLLPEQADQRSVRAVGAG